MYTKLSDLQDAVRRLEPALQSELQARALVASVLGHGTWEDAVSAVRSGDPSYPAAWVGRARRTYWEATRQHPRAPTFDEVFVAGPPCAGDDLPLEFFAAVSAIARRSFPFHLETPEDLVGGFAAGAEGDWRTLSADWGDATLCIRPLEGADSTSALWFYAWSAWTVLDGKQVSHADGTLFATKRGHWVEPDEAVDAADMVSDAAVAAVAAIAGQGDLEGLRGRHATLEKLYVTPGARGSGLGLRLLEWVCLELKKIKSGDFALVLDASSFIGAICLPPELKSVNAIGPQGQGMTLAPHVALQLAFDEKILQRYRDVFHPHDINVDVVKTLRPFGRCQTMWLVSAVAATGEIPEFIPSEEVARQNVEQAQSKIADALSGTPPSIHLVDPGPSKLH